MPVITPVYAGLLSLLFLYLSARVIRKRQIARISVGDGGAHEMAKRIRVQANFAEYVPLALLLMVLAELQGNPAWFLHLSGGMLILGRALHAFGLGRSPQIPLARTLGTMFTFLVIGAGAIALIGNAVK